MTKIEHFAKEVLGIELISYQIEYIKALMGDRIVVMARQEGRLTAVKVLQAYVKEGFKDE
jgi:hypothetical protein